MPAMGPICSARSSVVASGFPTTTSKSDMTALSVSYEGRPTYNKVSPKPISKP
jgi:hypothetical protein